MTEMEEMRTIYPFSNYGITNWGRVFNLKTGREMVLSPTEHGELTVGLMHEGTQYRRSVKVLVAKAFVEGENDIFDTPLLLDGDRDNLRADNIVWRPRWFALAYIQQFDDEPEYYSAGPVLDSNGNEYEDVLEAAMMTGSLCKDIRDSIFNDTRVFPHGMQFTYKLAK